MLHKLLLVCLGAFVFGAPAAWAAPALRISVPTQLKRPIWVPAGTNGPTDLRFEAWNDGDGDLNVSVSGGPVDWLRPTVSGTQPCAFDGSRTCTIILVNLATSALAPGTYTGDVVVEDAGAVDAPQRVGLKIYVGGNVPASIDLYVPPTPNSSDFRDFQTPEGPAPGFTINGSHLLVTSDNLGSFRSLHTHRVMGIYSASLSEGDLPGAVTVQRSSFASDNRDIDVTLHVTREPVMQLSAQTLVFSTAADVPAGDQFLSLSNRGMGELTIAGVDVETKSGVNWLSAEAAGGSLYRVRADVGSVAAGLHQGLLRIRANAANAPLEVVVWFFVNPQTGPISGFRGAVNGATFDISSQLTPGAIVSIFGSQLSYAFGQAAEIPLPRDLEGTRVLIDGIEAPLIFVSYGQINLQVPFEVGQGAKVIQVIRDGRMGNRISASIATRSAGIFRLQIGEYGAIQNASQGNLPLPVALGQRIGLATAPARAGDVLVIYATGLGLVTPAVATGEAAGFDPLSVANETPVVVFGRSTFGPRATPSFVGLSPGFVGLFQINVVVPEGVPTDDRLGVNLSYPDGRGSNIVELAVQR